jgi:ribosomal protein L19
MVFNELQVLNLKKNFIQFRKAFRRKIKGFRVKTFFLVGDVVKIVFFKFIHPLVFEGICISLRRRGFAVSDVSFILRNIILGVGVEVRLSYFLNRLYSLSLSDFKRKFDFLGRNKLLAVRSELNKHSRI